MNLDESAVGGLLRMEEVVPAMERALADFSSGTVVQPVRTMLLLAGLTWLERDLHPHCFVRLDQRPEQRTSRCPSLSGPNRRR